MNNPDRQSVRTTTASCAEPRRQRSPAPVVTMLLSLRSQIVTELAQRRADYQQMLASLDHALRESHDAAAGEDVADIGSRALEHDQVRFLTASRREHIGQLEEALRRIDDGSYGRCENCSAPIPRARLEAYPAATMCVACKIAAPHR